jgi:DNA-binding transcriptional MocR family regulator
MYAVDPRDSVPLHEQVAAQIRRALADGEAQPGERLPPARDLATVLGVNANTASVRSGSSETKGSSSSAAGAASPSRARHRPGAP